MAAELLGGVRTVNAAMGAVLALATLLVVAYGMSYSWRHDPLDQDVFTSTVQVVFFGLILVAAGLFTRFYYTVPGWGTYYDVLSLWFGFAGGLLLVASPAFWLYFRRRSRV